jgi:hypothetical protein
MKCAEIALSDIAQIPGLLSVIFRLIKPHGNEIRSWRPIRSSRRRLPSRPRQHDFAAPHGVTRIGITFVSDRHFKLSSADGCRGGLARVCRSGFASPLKTTAHFS